METDLQQMNVAEPQHSITQASERLKERARNIDKMPYIDTRQNVQWIRNRTSVLNE